MEENPEPHSLIFNFSHAFPEVWGVGGGAVFKGWNQV